SLEPWELPDGLWDLFANPRLMPHLHLPLQSGADSVLRRMARRCRTEEFARLASEARARVPGIHLTTDIIAGFPGETDAEWRQTLDFVAAIGFGQVHIFAYSPRPGTKAASLPDQVPAEVKKERSREMHELARRMKADTFAHYLGHQTTILLEGRQGSDPEGDRYGYTPHYLPVSLPSSKGQDLTNQLLRVELTAIHPDGDSLIATLAPQTHPLPDHEDAGASPAMGTLVGPAPA
ncbi:MAG: radical SAM protein, partial [Chromatiaceae bacterium]